MSILRLPLPLLALCAAIPALALEVLPPSEERIVFPPHANVVDVKKPPYSAKGDGGTDDTAALQLAISENTGRHRVIYFPAGTYLVSATLKWPKTWKGKDKWGFTTLQGERGGTLMDTRSGGQSEIFGTFSYTTTAGKLAPMFVTTDSSVFAFFGEVCYSGDPFATVIPETQGGQVKEVKRGEGGTLPYSTRSAP